MTVDAQSILVSVLAKAGLDYLSGTFASTDPQIVEIVDLINETGCDLARRGQWHALLASWSGTPGAMPVDFAAVASVISDGRQARLVVDPGQWAFIAANPTSALYFRVGPTGIDISPPVPFVLSYWSSSWSSTGSKVTADGDEVYLPASCMIGGTFYRWLRKKGLPYDDVMAQHEADVASAQKADRGM